MRFYWINMLHQTFGLKPQKTMGFTLIEVMVTICIFSIGLLAVASMQTGAIKANDTAFDLSEASYLAENKIEELMLLPFTANDLTDTDSDGDASAEDADGDGDDDNGGNYGLDDHTVATADFNQTYVSDKSGTYTIFWNIADGVPVPDTPTSNTKTIRVIVAIPDAANRRVSIDYIKADRF